MLRLYQLVCESDLVMAGALYEALLSQEDFGDLAVATLWPVDGAWSYTQEELCSLRNTLLKFAERVKCEPFWDKWLRFVRGHHCKRLKYPDPADLEIENVYLDFEASERSNVDLGLAGEQSGAFGEHFLGARGQKTSSKHVHARAALPLYHDCIADDESSSRLLDVDKVHEGACRANASHFPSAGHFRDQQTLADANRPNIALKSNEHLRLRESLDQRRSAPESGAMHRILSVLFNSRTVTDEHSTAFKTDEGRLTHAKRGFRDLHGAHAQDNDGQRYQLNQMQDSMRILEHNHRGNLKLLESLEHRDVSSSPELRLESTGRAGNEDMHKGCTVPLTSCHRRLSTAHNSLHCVPFPSTQINDVSQSPGSKEENAAIRIQHPLSPMPAVSEVPHTSGGRTLEAAPGSNWVSAAGQGGRGEAAELKQPRDSAEDAADRYRQNVKPRTNGNIRTQIKTKEKEGSHGKSWWDHEARTQLQEAMEVARRTPSPKKHAKKGCGQEPRVNS